MRKANGITDPALSIHLTNRTPGATFTSSALSRVNPSPRKEKDCTAGVGWNESSTSRKRRTILLLVHGHSIKRCQTTLWLKGRGKYLCSAKSLTIGEPAPG